MNASIQKEASQLRAMLSERYRMACEYINNGMTGIRFWDNRAEKREDNHAYTGSKERFTEKLPELKQFGEDFQEKQLRMFCIEEAETWFSGFKDDTTKNRMNFTASLYKELKPLL